MKTFTQIVKRAARKAYREVVLPELKKSARDLARQGIADLKSDATSRGLTGYKVKVTYLGPYKEKPHQRRLLKMVKRRLPVDVQVWEDSGQFWFEVAKLYSDGTGSREYTFPHWRISENYICHNLEFLKTTTRWSSKIEAFTRVLEYFDCKSHTYIHRMYQNDSKRPSLNIRVDDNWKYILQIILEWSQKNPSKIINLHRTENPDEIYGQIEVADYRLLPEKIQALQVGEAGRVAAMTPVEIARRIVKFKHPEVSIRSGMCDGGGYSVVLISRLTNFEVVVKDDGKMKMTAFEGKVSDLEHVQEILSLARSIVRKV